LQLEGNAFSVILI